MALVSWINDGLAKSSPTEHSAQSTRTAEVGMQSPTASPIAVNSSEAIRGASEAVPEASLPPLPEITRLDATQPTAEDVQDLEARLAALFSDERDARDAAIGELIEVRPKIVAAIHLRLAQLADRSDKEKLKRYINDVRRQAKTGPSGSAHDSPAAARSNGSDLLATLLGSDKSRDQSWRESASLVALLRMSSATGTVEGARELIFAYARFGEFIRPEVQQRLSEMKDRAIAAIIEARRHPAEKISRWAGLRLDQLGKAIPGEAVRTEDYDALGDILRAYGRIRDPDAARIIVSFANSERSQLRLAARQAIALLGPVGLWQLRDAYEDVVGRRPRRDWTWEHTARELFGEFDRLRLARVYGTFVEGLEHLKKGELEEMGKCFDSVLAKDPLFEKRTQMAEGYFKLAKQLATKNPDGARQAAIRVERLANEARLKNQARSLVITLRAAASADRGLLETDRLERAIELDPDNRRAHELLAIAMPDSLRAQSATLRWIASAVIGGFGLLAVLFVLLRRSGERQTGASKT